MELFSWPPDGADGNFLLARDVIVVKTCRAIKLFRSATGQAFASIEFPNGLLAIAQPGEQNELLVAIDINDRMLVVNAMTGIIIW